MSENINRRTLLAALAGAPAGLLLGAQRADAVLMPYIVNRRESVANLSITITTPNITLRSLKPIYGAPAYGFYASLNYTTTYWQIGGAAARTAVAGKWTWLPAGKDWQVMVMPKVH